MEQPQTATPTTPAASSTAPVTAQTVLDGMDVGERATFEKSGTMPERLTKPASAPPKIADQNADAAPAKPVEQATGDESAAPPAAKGPKERKPRNADTRVDELLAERAALRLRVESLERERTPKHDQPASDPAAATQKEWERILALPGAPRLEQFESIEAYTAAASLFVTDTRWQEHESEQRATSEQQRRHADFEAVTAAAKERVQKAMESNKDFATQIDERLIHLLDSGTVHDVTLAGGKPGPHNVLAEEILRSESIEQLLLHFSTEQGQQDWRRLVTSRSHGEFLRAFGRLEADLSRAASAAPAPKLVSDAPDPAPTLGTKPANAGDPILAAAKGRDIGRYIDLANARDLAARR